MVEKISLRCKDRMSTSVVVRIETDKTIKDLKCEVAKYTGKGVDQITLRKGKRELIDVIDIDTYELRDGECVEIEYR